MLASAASAMSCSRQLRSGLIRSHRTSRRALPLKGLATYLRSSGTMRAPAVKLPALVAGVPRRSGQVRSMTIAPTTMRQSPPGSSQLISASSNSSRERGPMREATMSHGPRSSYHPSWRTKSAGVTRDFTSTLRRKLRSSGSTNVSTASTPGPTRARSMLNFHVLGNSSRRRSSKAASTMNSEFGGFTIAPDSTTVVKYGFVVSREVRSGA